MNQTEEITDQTKEMTEMEQTLRLVRITCRFIIFVFVAAIATLALFVLCGILGAGKGSGDVIFFFSFLISIVLSIFVTMRIEHFGKS